MIDNDQWDAFLEAYEELRQKYEKLTKVLMDLINDGEHEEELLDNIKEIMEEHTNG